MHFADSGFYVFNQRGQSFLSVLGWAACHSPLTKLKPANSPPSCPSCPSWLFHQLLLHPRESQLNFPSFSQEINNSIRGNCPEKHMHAYLTGVLRKICFFGSVNWGAVVCEWPKTWKSTFTNLWSSWTRQTWITSLSCCTLFTQTNIHISIFLSYYIQSQCHASHCFVIKMCFLLRLLCPPVSHRFQVCLQVPVRLMKMGS